MASPYAAELAMRQVFGPIEAKLDAPIESMADVRRLQKTIQTIHDVLDDHAPDTADKLFRASQRRERQSYDSAHQWKCRALGLNPATTPTLALGGMTPINLDGWFLGIACPAPSSMAPDMTEITTLVLLDPKTGKASIYKDKAAQLVAPVNTREFTVHADATTWARDFARSRLEFVRTAQAARRIANIPPVWHGRPPSALAIGKLEKIDWPFAEIVTAGEGVDAKALNRILRKPITRVHAPMNLRTAA
jgi:hypothetical protein